MSTSIKLFPPTWQGGNCIQDIQEFVNFIFTGTGEVQGGPWDLVIQEDEPEPEDRGKVWIRLFGGLVDRKYTYFNGQWVSRHPITPASEERRIFCGLAVDVVRYDGGDEGILGDASGAMWEIDPLFAARMPIGVGTLPLAGTVIAVNDTGGADQMAIAKANLPVDKLLVNTKVVGQASVTSGGLEPVVGSGYGSEPISGAGGACDGTQSQLSDRYYTKGQTDEMGSGDKLTVMNPYIGVYFLKRTSRLYYTPL